MLAGLALGAAAAPQDDALQSPACLAARERLDAVMAEPKPDIAQLRAARQRAARACFRAEADAAPPSRSERPMIVLPPAGGSKPAQPLAPATPDTPAIAAPAAPQPPQVARCDAGGCWDSSGQRLNRAGNQLVNPQGGLCTQQGTVLSCP
ncbi:hypothetical protein [Pseudorhodoferax sp. Leaf274]|uniref:hypothetical protein n=1 Tax=Pseudorhodoferax sp. Leaf274 TaxID=1736318 RepID=UPI0007028B7E|nr:hypothetical protein [Pseudorhodoferax sp. Leaf274]KQP38081.1 hypothetical protein ASF44_12765 [Pseudorhodoferax sp. Leaf274]